MITTDKNNPLLNNVKENGQNEAYLVLNEEERSKGFIRPYRNSYIHVGTNWNKIPHEIRPIEDSFKDRYAAILYHVKDNTGKFIGGKYITEAELLQLQNGGIVGGCGTKTIMSKAIAETYAVEPKYYGLTFCVGCRKHLPVNEFLWDGTNEEVGS